MTAEIQTPEWYCNMLFGKDSPRIEFFAVRKQLSSLYSFEFELVEVQKSDATHVVDLQLVSILCPQVAFFRGEGGLGYELSWLVDGLLDSRNDEGKEEGREEVQQFHG